MQITMNIRLINFSDAVKLSEYYQKNAKHFRKWEPRQAYNFHSIENWNERIRERVFEQEQGNAAYIAGFDHTKGEIIGHCTLSQIYYGPFQACYMGYGISKEYEGTGKMQKICQFAIEHAFHRLGLNRIMANYLPHNNRSAKLLKTLGFTIEGFARDYLKINGKWHNHVLTSLVNNND